MKLAQLVAALALVSCGGQVAGQSGQGVGSGSGEQASGSSGHAGSGADMGSGTGTSSGADAASAPYCPYGWLCDTGIH